MKKYVKIGILSAVVLFGTIFIISSFLKASRPPRAADTPAAAL